MLRHLFVGLLLVVTPPAIAACGRDGGVEISPIFQHDMQGDQLQGDEIVADDAAAAIEQVEVLFAPFGVPDAVEPIVADVDYGQNFLVSGTIGLCSPPTPVDPKMVIEDDGTWRLTHSTDEDDDVLCEALNETWMLFVVDRQHRSLFE